jgi:two-component system LytT family response regulator
MKIETQDKIIRTLIIDDEPVACELLDWMTKQDPDIRILGIFNDGRNALNAIREIRPDLIFLDIQMPDLDGFALLENLRQHELPYFIFVTASDSYAIRAFDIQAIDYLLKPFTQRRFQKALSRAKERILGRKQLALLLDDSSGISTHHLEFYLQRVEVRLDGRIYYLPVSEIFWIESADQYAEIHCATTSYLVRLSMVSLEKQLDPEQFVRIHRSAIVHVNEVKEAVLNREKGTYLILKNGKRLKISRRRLAGVRKSSLSPTRIR